MNIFLFKFCVMGLWSWQLISHSNGSKKINKFKFHVIILCLYSAMVSLSKTSLIRAGVIICIAAHKTLTYRNKNDHINKGGAQETDGHKNIKTEFLIWTYVLDLNIEILYSFSKIILKTMVIKLIIYVKKLYKNMKKTNMI